MRPRKRKRSEFTPIGDIVTKVLRRYRKDFDEDISRIWQCWEQAAGPAVAQNTRPTGIRNNLLLVEVNSSSWLFQLRFLKKDLIGNVNRMVGKELVEDIKFKVGPF